MTSELPAFLEDIETPLPRSQLLTARDLADFFDVDVNTVYVWAHRGILHPRNGRYDWREAALWLVKRKAAKINEPTATRTVI